MQRLKKGGACLLCLLLATPAVAEPYFKAEAWLANLSTMNGNVGGAVGVGYDFGPVRLEGEISQHVHLGIGIMSLTVMAYAEPWAVGRFAPYLGLGGGDSVVQGALGGSFGLTESVALTAGYLHRCYDFGCGSVDGAATVGLRVKF